MSTFVSLFGDKLQSKDGEIPTGDALDGKVVGVYFSAHWCPPCRTFTPELTRIYKKLTEEQKKDFEIVFVSSDNDDAGFNEYYGDMPWLALPYVERERKSTLSSKFKVSGIPTLVILDKNGSVITKDGRSQVDADPEGANFPWVPPEVKDVIGTDFIGKNGAKITLDQLSGKYIGIYFSAHWCPPCKGFTPILGTLYETMKEKGKNFEVIFASSDKNEAQFNEYYAEMPWLAIPYEDRKRKTDLSQKFNVTGIPCLVILDPDLNVINSNARLRAQHDTEGADFPWGPKPLINLDDDPTNINDYPSIFFVKGDMPDDAAAAVKDELKKLGQEYIDKAKQAKEEQEFMFFYSEKKGGKISSQLIGAMDLSDSNNGMLILIDIPDQGKFHLSVHGVPKREHVQLLLDGYKSKSMNFSQLQ